MSLRFWLPAVVLWVLFALVVMSRQDAGTDFRPYYDAAQAVRSGSSPYQMADSLPYLYPPLFAALLAPVAAVLSLKATVTAWTLLNLGLLVATLALLGRCIGQSRPRAFIWLAPVFFAPVLETLWLGQIAVLMFALTVGIWAAARAGRMTLAGLLLALAAWIKVYPALLVLYFAWKREWGVVRGVVVGGLVLALLQVLAAGWQTMAAYFTDVLPHLGAEGTAFGFNSNNSIAGFANRLFMAGPGANSIPLIDNPALAGWSRLALTLVFLGVTIWLVARPARFEALSRRQFDLQFALVTLLALLLSTALWISSLTSLLLVYVIALIHAPEGRRGRSLIWVLLSFALICFHFWFIIGSISPPSTTMAPALLLSTPFIGLLLIYTVVARLTIENPEHR